MGEEALRPAVVGDDLDKLYYADEPEEPPLPRKRVPCGDVYEAARAGDVDRLKLLLEAGVNVNARDDWDSVALYYACLAGHLDAAQLLLESGAICSEHTFDGDRCHYAALNLGIRRLLKSFEARPPPLKPLHEAFRLLFFRSGANSRYADPTLGRGDATGSDGAELEEIVAPDIVFYVEGKPISAHRAILAARCELFRRKFAAEWKSRTEVRFARNRLSFPALFSLIGFFYTDRLDIAVDDMEDLLKICATCGCRGLYGLVSKELVHQKYADYKSLQETDDFQKRFILQGYFLPEEQRLPAAMARLLDRCLERSSYEGGDVFSEQDTVVALREEMQDKLRIGNQFLASSSSYEQEDYADLCFVVGERTFRCHSCVVAARSEYVRARILRMTGFSEGKVEGPEEQRILEEHDITAAVFEKLLRYIYTDAVDEPDFDEAAQMLDGASRYLLFPLKRAVADAVLPRLENATPVQLCQWLLLADMYGVWKIREYCLDSMALNFEVFAATPEFREMLRKLPPPSGESAARTSAPSAPGVVREGQENLLDDLREKWLEAEAAELDKRDESARHFDRRLELLIEAAGNDDMES